MDPLYIKYTPSKQSVRHNSSAKQRIIKLVDMPKDLLEPPKFKHKRIPRAFSSPPVPLMHSPPRPVTRKDQLDWTVPPCTSNWKNPKGYTIPLNKRLASDGRRFEEVHINEKFAEFSEAMHVAVQKSREAVEMRAKIQKEPKLKEEEKRNSELAQKARMVKSTRVGDPVRIWASDGGKVEEGQMETKEERQEHVHREALRDESRRERGRKRRLETNEGHVGKKIKFTRDGDRDISEKMALNMADTKSGGGTLTYDQRLFNQEKGMESGYVADVAYNVYDKVLFSSKFGLSRLCHPQKHKSEVEVSKGLEGQFDKHAERAGFRSGKGFGRATERGGPQDTFVEFEKDPFGLDQFLTEVNKEKKV